MPFLKTNFQHFKFDLQSTDSSQQANTILPNLSINLKDLLEKIKISNIYEKKRKNKK